MNVELLKETIKRELPGLLRDAPALRAYILELTRREYAGRAETQDRFYDLLAELRRDREERAREWDEYKDEQNRRWEANQVELRRLHEEIMAQAQKHERGIGALGSRWGLQSEKAFRDASAGILEKNFGVQVVNVNEYDDWGEVFGRPDQVELDMIVKNGLLLISPMIDARARKVAERLGIETYGDSTEVEAL
ncbi:MAG: DUF3782 domain-containing protein [Candidatus Competibacter sp.]|nr:DUF3782 domain-containing protein [Candidatus Competibacter sp.]